MRSERFWSQTRWNGLKFGVNQEVESKKILTLPPNLIKSLKNSWLKFNSFCIDKKWAKWSQGSFMIKKPFFYQPSKWREYLTNFCRQFGQIYQNPSVFSGTIWYLAKCYEIKWYLTKCYGIKLCFCQILFNFITCHFRIWCFWKCLEIVLGPML